MVAQRMAATKENVQKMAFTKDGYHQRGTAGKHFTKDVFTKEPAMGQAAKEDSRKIAAAKDGHY